MKHYIGTKRIIAAPMNRRDYNAYRGWQVPADENPDDEGFLVEYLDGGKPNDPRHAGYISWSPAEVFARSYREVAPPVEGLHPHQQRVIDEQRELAARLDKLSAFCHSPAFNDVDPEERMRLSRQHMIMVDLNLVLLERIAAFASHAEVAVNLVDDPASAARV